MKHVVGCVLTIALVSLACQAVAHAQRERRLVHGPLAAQQAWTPPRTPDGHPDLQGIWDYRSATPLERPARFAGREFMTPAEVVEYERQAAQREDGRPPDDPRTEQSVHPAWWLDYGKTVVKTARTSLIVDPPDGRVPALSAEGERRLAARRAAARTRGPVDSYEDRGLFERCITRGVPAGMLPGPYNNNLQVVQTSGYVVLFTEMIHDARIVPLDGRPHAGPNSRQWLGDSRGRWEGDTLVIDTTNFTDKTSFRGSGANLHLVERFTRIDRDTLEYRFTVDDPSTWTRPWTVSYPMVKTEGPIYEYACHEGNYGLMNILSGARWQEKAAEEAKQTAVIVPDKVIALFNGRDLSGWSADVPDKDTNPNAPASFIVRNGMLVSLGIPRGHLLTESTYRDYRLEVEYRFPGSGGNCGVLVHASKPRALSGMFPQSIEVQMQHQNAGDFWCIRENIEVPDMEKRRPRKEGQSWGGGPNDARRILNLTDSSERPIGEWNTMVIEARGRTLKVWVNGDLVNEGFGATADSGKIALQAEGTEVEFRRVEMKPLPPAAR